MILVVGHKNPDSDSICSALVATELLKARGEEATPIRQGEINRETQHILEEALTADFAIVKAAKGDTAGNLIFEATARNFNPMMAMAGKTTIAEVEELVELGELEPNAIHTPGIFVQRIFQGDRFEKRIEQRTTRAKQ